MSLESMLSLLDAAGVDATTYSPMELFTASGRINGDSVLTMRVIREKSNGAVIPEDAREEILRTMSLHERAVFRARVGL